MQCGGKQIRNIICTYNDGDGTVAKRSEERASNVRGLWARDGGGITGFSPHVTTREGKGEKMDMDGCSNGEGRAKDISDGIPERRGKNLPSQRVPGEGGDEDGDARALLEKACARHCNHPRRGKPSSPLMRELLHVGAVAVP